MTQICGKWLKYVGKWLNYLTNGLKIWKLTQRFGNWPKSLENGLDKWDTALVFENNNNNNDFISIALFHVKHAELR